MEKQFQPLKAWTVAIVITLAEVAFGINMFKVPAAIVQIGAAFQIDAIGTGWLMNAVGIVSFLLSIPSGMVMQKVGPRRLLIILFIVNIVGSTLGALSIALAPSYAVLILSRVIEGFAYGLVGTTATAFISAWFPLQRRGMPNALTTLYVSIGQLIIFLACAALIPQANLIAPTFDFVNAWYVSIAALVIMFVLTLIFLRMPPDEQSFLVTADAPKQGEKPSMLEGFKAPTIWLMFVLFSAFGMVTAAFGIYYPEYLQSVLGMSYLQANYLTSICTVALMVGGFIGGIILLRIPPRKRSIYLLIVSLPVPILGFVMFLLPSADWALPFLIIYGLIIQIFPGAVLTMAPEASHSYATMSITMGILMLGSNFAGVLGVTVTSMIIVSGGYASCAISNTICGIIGLAAIVGIIFTMRRRWAVIDATGEDIE